MHNNTGYHLITLLAPHALLRNLLAINSSSFPIVARLRFQTTVASITMTWSSAFIICMQRTFFAMDFRQL